MRLIIVRHAESTGNAKRLNQGHLNFRLTKKGRKQAKLVAKRLRCIRIDAGYSSDSSRCSGTAKEILKFHPKIKLVLAKDLRERGKGIFEGKHHSVMEIFLKESRLSYKTFKPEGGGESYFDVKKRVVSFFKKVYKKHKNDNVMFVSHGAVMSYLMIYLLKKPYNKRHEYLQDTNTAITILKINSGKAKIELFKCAKHLKENKK